MVLSLFYSFSNSISIWAQPFTRRLREVIRMKITKNHNFTSYNVSLSKRIPFAGGRWQLRLWANLSPGRRSSEYRRLDSPSKPDWNSSHISRPEMTWPWILRCGEEEIKIRGKEWHCRWNEKSQRVVYSCGGRLEWQHDWTLTPWIGNLAVVKFHSMDLTSVRFLVTDSSTNPPKM